MSNDVPALRMTATLPRRATFVRILYRCGEEPERSASGRCGFKREQAHIQTRHSQVHQRIGSILGMARRLSRDRDGYGEYDKDDSKAQHLVARRCENRAIQKDSPIAKSPTPV
jgi:hypothetical protein